MNFQDVMEYARLTEVDWDIISETAQGFYVEVGTHRGASAAVASQSADRVVTIDIYDWGPKVYTKDNVEFFKGTSVDFADVFDMEEDGPIDVLFIDGGHEYDAVMLDCRSLIPLVKPGGFVLFHDHNPNNPNTGVYVAVNEYLENLPHTKFPKLEGSGNMLKIQKL